MYNTMAEMEGYDQKIQKCTDSYGYFIEINLLGRELYYSNRFSS